MSTAHASEGQPSGARFRTLLVSCYELGRQPFNIASPWAQLAEAGFDVQGVDTSIQSLDDVDVEGVDLIAISVPMHTALRLGMELVKELRARAPEAHVCFFGMYAALNAERLLSESADSVIGGEFEEALVALAVALQKDRLFAAAIPGVVRAAEVSAGQVAEPVLRKLPFVTPKRDELPELSRYATFFGPKEGETRMVAYVEASRGCLHRCRHCPVTAIYRGKFFIVPKDVVLADAAQQIEAGARHVTFGDPDFFNGPKHVMQIARALASEHPGVTFDVTVKVEHILRYRHYLKELADLGCAFVISAVESLSDEVLRRLDKGHTRADITEALALTREAGLAMRPTLVAFTPWTTLEDYVELVDWILTEQLVDYIEPIQLAIRLLVPPGSALTWPDEDMAWLGEVDEAALGHTWNHPDARMDGLFETVSQIVEDGADADPAETLQAIRDAAYAAAGAKPRTLPALVRSFVPHLSESWFCCAEPTARQMKAVTDKCQNSSPCG